MHFMKHLFLTYRTPRVCLAVSKASAGSRAAGNGVNRSNYSCDLLRMYLLIKFRFATIIRILCSDVIKESHFRKAVNKNRMKKHGYCFMERYGY